MSIRRAHTGILGMQPEALSKFYRFMLSVSEEKWDVKVKFDFSEADHFEFYSSGYISRSLFKARKLEQYFAARQRKRQGE